MAVFQGRRSRWIGLRQPPATGPKGKLILVTAINPDAGPGGGARPRLRSALADGPQTGSARKDHALPGARPSLGPVLSA